MRNIIGSIILAATAALSVSCTQGGSDAGKSPDIPPVSPGQWERSFQFSKIDVPTLGRKEKARIMDEMAQMVSGTSCLQPEAARRPNAGFFGGGELDDCTYGNVVRQGDNMHIELTCTMDGMGSVDMVLTGPLGTDSYAFDAQVAMRLPIVGKVGLVGKADGRMTGACPKTA